jgi:cytochrome c oxidase assembly protein Cox11
VSSRTAKGYTEKPCLEKPKKKEKRKEKKRKERKTKARTMVFVCFVCVLSLILSSPPLTPIGYKFWCEYRMHTGNN